MNDTNLLPSNCPAHGRPTKRSSCLACNAAYMRSYLRRRRITAPARAIWERAKGRARRRDVPFAIAVDDVNIPPTCPVLGIPIVVEGKRSPNSPSLDRIRPERGYVPGNVRVISDRANRLKGARTFAELRRKASDGPTNLRVAYSQIASYVDREALLGEVRLKASASGAQAAEWSKVADFLDKAFAKGLPTSTPKVPGREPD